MPTKQSKQNNRVDASSAKEQGVLSSSKMIIALGLACSIGILFWQGNGNDETSEKITAQTSQGTPSIEASSKPTATTSDLIQRAADAHIEADTQSNEAYPNVTPATLETPFSPTLVGTEIDGQIRVDEHGKVVVDLAVKDFFDYFLSAVGEVSAELALDELMRVISESLPPENAKEAVVLLDNYLAYKEAAVELMAQPMLPADQQTREYQMQVLKDSLAQMKALRREHMPGAQVEAFFGMEEAYEQYTIAAIEIQFDETLSADEKAQLVAYQRSLLPEAIRNTEERVAQEQVQNTEIQAAIQANDEETLQAKLAESGYSPEAQESVLAHKRQQDAFDVRYQAYVNEKMNRLSAALNKAEQEQILQALQREYFLSETEITQARVRDLRG